jgi:hypothetical protein
MIRFRHVRYYISQTIWDYWLNGKDERSTIDQKTVTAQRSLYAHTQPNIYLLEFCPLTSHLKTEIEPTSEMS